MATPRPIQGRIGDHGSWRIVHCRPGRFFCAVEQCTTHARWKGLVGAEDFNSGRTCDEHWPNLVRVVKDIADGWLPAPARH